MLCEQRGESKDCYMINSRASRASKSCKTTVNIASSLSVYLSINTTVNKQTQFFSFFNESNIFPSQSHLPLCSCCGCGLFQPDPRG